MQILEIFEQNKIYNFWANNEILSFLQSSSSPSPKATRIFAHLLVAEKIWLERMQKNLDTSGFNFWAGESVAECAKLLAENKQNFDEFFSVLNQERLETISTYRNSQGKAFENTWREALAHVFTHSAYHRGQIAAAIRETGAAPPNTDFINFLRVR